MARALTVLALLLAAARAFGEAAGDARAVLNLTGRPDGSRPDILFLAPCAPEGEASAYREALAPAENAGTALPNARLGEGDFRTGGILPVLGAADYAFLPVRDVPWRAACSNLVSILTLRRRTRVEDGIEQAPLCALLRAEASAGDLAATLPGLLGTDALIFLAPRSGEKGARLPLVVCWRNMVWPGHRVSQSVHPEHWAPTLAEIVGLPPPAEVGAVSILPMLTGVGYQRPLGLPGLPAGAVAVGAKPVTMLCHYADLPENCPWVPDYTDVSSVKPSERVFLPHALPLPAKAAREFGPSRRAQGFYVRTTQSRMDLVFPAGVSCVVRVKGRPVFSEWAPTAPTAWRLDNPDPVPVEIFLVVPPRLDPATLPLFAAPERAGAKARKADRGDGQTGSEGSTSRARGSASRSA